MKLLGCHGLMAMMALAWLLARPSLAVPAEAARGERNLVSGKAVVFAPSPDYHLTSAGGTDATDLTDGKFTTSKTDRLWFDRACVGYSYAGQVQLSVDLGQVEAIEEVGIRLQGGSPQAGIALPPWVDVVVSSDRERWYRVASYSRWRAGDNVKYAIPRDEGRAWVHNLCFRDLRTCGRYVGLVLYTAAFMVSDELWVLKGSHDPHAVHFDERDRAAFAVDGVQMYFHKPVIFFSTDIHTPNPVGVIVAEGVKGTTTTVELDLPTGVRLAGGHLGDAECGDANPRVIQETDGEYTRYTVSCRASQTEKSWGRLFLSGAWEDGRRGHLRWRLRWADWNEWCLQKGAEMWMDVSTAVRSRPGMAKVDLGGYDFRPGASYQNIWPVDRLYPKFMQNTQVSIYTPLYPYHLELIGNEVRADRAKLPRSDILPWLTPGDAGVYPGEMFRYALLECFANGARGLHFWSGRLWDTELLAAYARVIRNVGPVESIIVDGELLTGAAAEPAARVSGMRRGNQMLLLVADYGKPPGTKAVKVTIPVVVESRVIDLDTGREVALVEPGRNSFTVHLDRELAQIFHIGPTE